MAEGVMGVTARIYESPWPKEKPLISNSPAVRHKLGGER